MQEKVQLKNLDKAQEMSIQMYVVESNFALLQLFFWFKFLMDSVIRRVNIVLSPM